MKSYNKDSDIGYFIEADVQYSKKLHELRKDLSFLPKRMKIEKVEKLAANFPDKKEYVIHIRNSKQALNHGLILKKVQRLINVITKLGLNMH